jgi:Gpi18-like mannosyltransferase/predicted small secreted protein
MKRLVKLVILVILVIAASAVGLSACNPETEVGKELLLNGSFEGWISDSDGASGKFNGWTKGSFGTETDYNVQRMSHSSGDKTKPEDAGSYALIITNDKATASYMSQSVKVDKNATYHIKYYVKLPSAVKVGADDYAAGPHLTFLESTGNILGEVTTVGSWIEVNVYVVPRNTDYLTVCLMLGSPGRAASGSAYFDSISMKRVDSVPAGTTFYEIFRDKVARYNVSTSGTLFVVFLSLFSAAILAVAYILVRRQYKDKRTFLNLDEHFAENKPAPKGAKKPIDIKRLALHPVAIACYLALFTFGVRLIFLLTMFGFGGETNNLVTLAGKIFNFGTLKTYEKIGAANATLSPGYIYILYIIGAAGKNIGDFNVSILIRLVSVLADIAAVLTIYFFGKHYVGNKLSTIYSALYALLPVSFALSGLRGTFDSVLIALLLIAVVLMIEKKFIPMFVLTVLAVLLDIRAMAAVPLMLFYLGYVYYRADSTLKTFGKTRATLVFGFVLSLAVFYCLAIPVALDYMQNKQPFFILTKYAEMMTSNNAFVNNAFNLYGMVGMNQKLVNQTAAVFNLIFILVLIIYVISLYVKNKNKLELLLLTSFTYAVIAVFTLKVSETYLILSLALMLVYIMIAGEKRAYIVFSLLSVLSFLAIAQLMNQSGFVVRYTTSVLIDYESTAAFYIVFSVFTVLATLYYGYVTYSICNNSKTVDILPMHKPFFTTIKEWTSKTLSKFKKA